MVELAVHNNLPSGVVVNCSYVSHNAHDTPNANLLHFWHCDITAILPSICWNAFSMVPCTLPAFLITNVQTSQFYHSTPLLITWLFCNFVLQLIETAVCFTFCMIQHPHLFIQPYLYKIIMNRRQATAALLLYRRQNHCMSAVWWI